VAGDLDVAGLDDDERIPGFALPHEPRAALEADGLEASRDVLRRREGERGEEGNPREQPRSPGQLRAARIGVLEEGPERDGGDREDRPGDDERLGAEHAISTGATIPPMAGPAAATLSTRPSTAIRRSLRGGPLSSVNPRHPSTALLIPTTIIASTATGGPR
jgi:hypothetical protein